MLKYKDEYYYRSICDTKTLQSNQKGFFLEFANTVLSTATTAWMTNVFSKCKSDEQRLKSIFEQKELREQISRLLQNVGVMYRKKNASVSKERRLQAEQLFNENSRSEKSLMIFGQAILRAPPKETDLQVDGGLSLALALWSRSELLLNLSHYENSLSDLKMALKEGLPAKHNSELYWRMARCYTGLGDIKKANVCFALAEKLETNVERKKKDKPKDIFNEKKTVNTLEVKEENQEWKSGSRLLKREESRNLGRYFVATEEINPGEVLLAENPYASCLMPIFFGSNCHHCFQRVLSPIGCSVCAGVAFCSEQCREAATYHKFECKIMDFLIGSGMSVLCHLALRMITKFDLKTCLQFHKKPPTIYGLCKLEKLREPRDFLYRTLMALFLVRCLQEVDFFPEKKDIENFGQNELKVAELLLVQLQFLQFNAHEIMEVRKTLREDRLQEIPIAIAVYSTASTFNHSCDPSVVRIFNNNKIVLIATKLIRPGESISENYGPTFTKMSREERQLNLESRYWFKCNCSACILCWPELTDVEEDFIQLRCSTENCNGIFILPDISGNCKKCGLEPSLDNSLVELGECENRYRQGDELYELKDYQGAVSMYLEGLQIFCKIGVPPHLQTYKILQNLKTCYLFLYTNVI